MSMTSNKSRLAGLTKEILLKWQETRESWQDAKSMEFERQYIAELEADVDSAAAVIEQLDKILAKLKSDCE
jgi:hypothetical protein